MSLSPSQPHPAEWRETERRLPTVERDPPAGRHQFHKERLNARIYDDLGHTFSHPARTGSAKARNPFLRRAVVLPVAACALAGAGLAGVQLMGGSDRVTGVAAGPAMTTAIGAADVHGVTRLLGRIVRLPRHLAHRLGARDGLGARCPRRRDEDGDPPIGFLRPAGDGGGRP